jgi:hypothetical protein
VSGFYPTVQSAITQICAISSGPAANGARVIVPAGSPADGASGYTIGAVTGGCTKVPIIDQRAQPATTCSWGGSSYSCSSGGGTGGISALTGDCTAAGTGSVGVTCTKTAGTPFAPSATVDTTNAANIASGIVGVPKGGTGAATLPSGLLRGNGTGPVSQATITDINSTIGYTPALGPNFTTDFTACYTFTETSTTTLIDHCGSNNGTVSGTAPVATGKSWQFSPNATTPIVLPAVLNSAKTWYFGLSIPAALAGGFTPSQVNTLLGNTVGGFTQLDINASNAISVNQSFGSFNSFAGSSNNAQIDNVFNGPAILTLVCTVGQPDIAYFNGVQAINTDGGFGGTSCEHMASGSFELGGSADSPNSNAFAEFYDVRMSNNAHTPAQVAQNVSALINEMSSRGVSLFPTTTKYVYPIQQLFFAGDSITCGFFTGGTPPVPCTNQASPYVSGANSSFAYENNLTLEQSFGNQAFGVPNAMIEQQASAASVLYAPLCYTQKGQSIGSLFEGTNNNGVESAAVTWSYAAGSSKLMHSFGCKTVFISMISRGQPATTAEAFKTAYTAVARANWKQAGFDAFIDMESDPFVGCFQCYSNATYFNTGDLTHPTQAGQLKIAAAVSATINYLSNGSTSSNPNPVMITGATHTSTFDDGGLIFDTTTNSIVDTLTSAQWMTGREIARCNNTHSGSNTLTITAPSDFPFNNVSGLTTVGVTNGTCQKFQSTYIAGTPNGDYWRVVD